ncbi:hypothetical protein F53441_11589 [Fusarium austroafricanum]|uniref:Methyltransferase n=1 Tax=Fusarium austroafricanum TaxID=2364996 RepID=A0A8H4K1H7_9HYPO|nr:hypothetical protein F53441_11589 [Fusarium austroafricanum]
MAEPAPLVNPVPLEVDQDPAENTDTNSFFESLEGSSTSSISSSILKYRQENGRTYHTYKDGQYHHLFLLTFDDKLYLCPAGRDGHQLHNVLDVGTGTGIWVRDVADENPNASVVRVDLSPIQSPFVPPNLSFQVDDIEEPWTFHVKFDLIYSRMVTGAMADWPGFFKRAYDNLAPGGWIEIADIYPIACDDGSLPKDSATAEWVDKLLEGTKLIGRAFDGAYKYKEQLEAQGFQNVQQIIFKWPMNTWPKDVKYKELGAWTLENVSSGLDGLSSAVYTRVLDGPKKSLMFFLPKSARNSRTGVSMHTGPSKQLRCVWSKA